VSILPILPIRPIPSLLPDTATASQAQVFSYPPGHPKQNRTTLKLSRALGSLSSLALGQFPTFRLKSAPEIYFLLGQPLSNRLAYNFPKN
jgi:hypothetical protein